MTKASDDSKEKPIPILREIMRPGRLGQPSAIDPPKPIVHKIEDPSSGSLTEIIDPQAKDSSKPPVSKLSLLGKQAPTSPISPAQKQQLSEELAQIVQQRLDSILPKLSAQISQDLQRHIDKRLRAWLPAKEKNK